MVDYRVKCPELTRMGAKMSLQGLLARKHTMANLALDAAGGLCPLLDKIIDDICSRTTSLGLRKGSRIWAIIHLVTPTSTHWTV